MSQLAVLEDGDLTKRHVVTALRHAHGDAPSRLLGTGETDETQDDHVPAAARVFKKTDLVACRIEKTVSKIKLSPILSNSLRKASATRAAS
jgi:hypothetical protein